MVVELRLERFECHQEVVDCVTALTSSSPDPHLHTFPETVYTYLPIPPNLHFLHLPKGLMARVRYFASDRREDEILGNDLYNVESAAVFCRGVVKNDEHRCNHCLQGWGPWVCYSFQTLLQSVGITVTDELIGKVCATGRGRRVSSCLRQLHLEWTT